MAVTIMLIQPVPVNSVQPCNFVQSPQLFCKTLYSPWMPHTYCAPELLMSACWHYMVLFSFTFLKYKPRTKAKDPLLTSREEPSSLQDIVYHLLVQETPGTSRRGGISAKMTAHRCSAGKQGKLSQCWTWRDVVQNKGFLPQNRHEMTEACVQHTRQIALPLLLKDCWNESRWDRLNKHGWW